MTIKEAINHVNVKGYGSLKELTTLIGKENVETLESTGLIKRGQESTKVDSWSSTKEIKKLYKITNGNRKRSFSEKLLDKFNCFLMKSPSKLSSY